jgi:hypothetical protein
MGRINKRSEVALKAAAEMLETTRNQSVKAQLIRVILDYDRRQQERADSNRAERRKRAENKEIAGFRSKVQELTSAASSKDEDLLGLKSKLEDTHQTIAELNQDLTDAKKDADTARKAAGEMQDHLKVTKEIIEHVARGVCAQKRSNWAAELFQKLKLYAREPLAQVFEAMGFDLKKWYSWDSEYGQNGDLMLEALLCPEKHEPEKLSLLRLKLAAMGMDCIDAINAVRGYRDLRIDFTQLKELTHPHVTFFDLDTRIENRIPEKFMPRLTEEALRNASATMKSDPTEKLKWLEVVEKLLEPDSGIGSLLLMELAETRRAADTSN